MEPRGMAMASMAKAAMAGLVAVLAAGTAWATPGALPPSQACAAQTSRYETALGIPPQLLHAISIVESGRWDAARRAIIAWPWTVSSGGRGQFFPTKAQAIAQVRRLRAKGIRNIDVGCMQVNLSYHPNAFASLDAAFTPATNVAYAARFLKALYSTTDQWALAASYYHSQTPSLAAAYRRRLMKVWGDIGTGEYRPPASIIREASLPALPPIPALRPRPVSPQVAAVSRSWASHSRKVRAEAARIAAAYRKATLAAYEQRQVHLVDASDNGGSFGAPY